MAALSVTFKHHVPREDGDGDEIAWALLSVSVYLEFSEFIAALFIPSERFGVFGLVVERLFGSDVLVFLTFFFLYLLMFWTSMYINYPRAGTGTVDIAPDFNSLFDSFFAMVNIGLAQGRLEMDLSSPAALHIDDNDIVKPLGDHSRLANLVIFTLFYYYCI